MALTQAAQQGRMMKTMWIEMKRSCYVNRVPAKVGDKVECLENDGYFLIGNGSARKLSAEEVAAMPSVTTTKQGAPAVNEGDGVKASSPAKPQTVKK